MLCECGNYLIEKPLCAERKCFHVWWRWTPLNSDWHWPFLLKGIRMLKSCMENVLHTITEQPEHFTYCFSILLYELSVWMKPVKRTVRTEATVTKMANGSFNPSAVSMYSLPQQLMRQTEKMSQKESGSQEHIPVFTSIIIYSLNGAAGLLSHVCEALQSFCEGSFVFQRLALG